MTVLTRSVRKATGIKAVGLCHEIAHVRWSFALLCGVGPDDVELTLTGVNHFPLVTGVRVGGRDGFDVLREVVDGTFEDTAWANEFTSSEAFRRQNRLKLALWEQWGALPAAGDRHLAEFLPGFLTEESGWGDAWGVHLTTIADRERDQATYVGRVADLLSGAEEPPQGDSGEMVAPFLDCLLTGTERVMPLNLPNEGQAADLPAGAVVESMVRVDGSGPHPGPPVAAPGPAAEVVRRHSAVQEMVVDAVLTQDRDLLTAAYALDPLAGRIDARAVARMADELLAATEAWLPPGW
jgi:alpha-galactosidase